MTRRRSEPHTFEQRLGAQKIRLESELACLPNGKQRDAVVARIEQLQTAADMHAFLSPGNAPAQPR
ncbi:hypothetical protein C2U70_09460 [Bradyrhizobium guangdongense]|nr:hypothetical protein C2U70_09460 [Bradyrhizobium guangdongense]